MQSVIGITLWADKDRADRNRSLVRGSHGWADRERQITPCGSPRWCGGWLTSLVAKEMPRAGVLMPSCQGPSRPTMQFSAPNTSMLDVADEVSGSGGRASREELPAQGAKGTLRTAVPMKAPSLAMKWPYSGSAV